LLHIENQLFSKKHRNRHELLIPMLFYMMILMLDDKNIDH